MFSSAQQSADRFRAAQFAHLRHLAIFALVVESGSFTLAAQRIGLGKSGVSRLITELEDFVGAKLLNRSTRSLSLTDAGQLMFADCAQLIEAAVNAIDKLDPDLPLAGTLSIAATTAHGHYVLPPIISEFSERHPDLNIKLTLSDSFVDLVDFGIDLAIRVGSPGPSLQYISRRIDSFQYRLFAQNDLLIRFPDVVVPQDLEGLPWLLSSLGPAPTDWTFTQNGRRFPVSIRGPVTVNHLMTRLEMARNGLGVIGIPDFVVSKALADGLSEVLPEYAIEPRVPIYAVYPSARFLSPKVSEFLDCLLKASREKKIGQLI